MKTKQIISAVIIAIAVTTYILPSVATAASCGSVETSIISCGGLQCRNEKGQKVDSAKDRSGAESCPTGASVAIESSGVWSILKMAIQIMTAGVGILAVGGIVYGSILYTSAGGSAEQVKKAVGIITNVVIGLIAYGFMFAITNFLIPGGLFT